MARRILIVDDSRHFRESAQRLLAARGLEVLGSVAGGEEALALVRADCPDGVLLDINMPGSDGYAVSCSLASECPGLTIVLTSSETDDVPPELLEECRATAFVPKAELAVVDLAQVFH